MKTRISYNEGLELRGSGMSFDENKGYYITVDGEKEYFTKKEASVIARILSSERSRLKYEVKSSAKTARARIKRTFTKNSFRPILSSRKNHAAYKERERLRKNLAEEDYIADLLMQYFPKANREDLIMAMTPEKIAGIMSKMISPYSATVRLDDPEGALAILGFTPDDFDGESAPDLGDGEEE